MLGSPVLHDTVSIQRSTISRADASHIYDFSGLLIGMSKLANIFWTSELQKRLDDENSSIIAISLNPGTVNTCADHFKYKALANIILGTLLKTWDQGAYNSAFAAASPLVRASPEAYKGKYIEGDYGTVVLPSKVGQDREMAARLWAITEEFVTDKGLC
jgi:hypothetical protein